MDRFPQDRQITVLDMTSILSEVDNKAFCPS
jgi:hypothetical protein